MIAAEVAAKETDADAAVAAFEHSIVCTEGADTDSVMVVISIE